MRVIHKQRRSAEVAGKYEPFFFFLKLDINTILHHDECSIALSFGPAVYAGCVQIFPVTFNHFSTAPFFFFLFFLNGTGRAAHFCFDVSLMSV